MVEAERGTFEVFVKGEGPPLCVSHLYAQYNESGDLFADCFTRTNTVFLVNLRGTGESERAVHAYQFSLLETVFDLESIRHALGYKTWGFAGHSTGGMIGLMYGAYASTSLKNLIIVGSAAREYFSNSPQCIYNEEHPQYQHMQELIEKLKDPNLSKDERDKIKIQRTKLSLFRPENYDEYFTADVQKGMAVERMNFFAREVHTYDITKKLSYITTPTLILCGKHDVQCPVEYSVEMNALIENSKLIIFHESNHYPFLEEQVLYQKEVDTFLASV
nr:alpha/beta hydrolase [Pontibacillus sp. HMF3514]